MTILTRNHADLALEVKAHIEADAVIQGEYWDGSKGCFIGCLTHSSDPELAVERFGLPEPLLRIAENIFEALPDDEGRAFFAALPDAVGCDGKDLSRVHWTFLAAELRLLPTVPADIQAVIDLVIKGMDTLASGEDWSQAAYAADAAYAYADADAAYAAYAAAYVADAACAYAAAYVADAACADVDAADAAYAAADAAYAARTAADAIRAVADATSSSDYAKVNTRIRQRDSLLERIKKAPMGDQA